MSSSGPEHNHNSPPAVSTSEADNSTPVATLQDAFVDLELLTAQLDASGASNNEKYVAVVKCISEKYSHHLSHINLPALVLRPPPYLSTLAYDSTPEEFSEACLEAMKVTLPRRLQRQKDLLETSQADKKHPGNSVSVRLESEGEIQADKKHPGNSVSVRHDLQDLHISMSDTSGMLVNEQATGSGDGLASQGKAAAKTENTSDTSKEMSETHTQAKAAEDPHPVPPPPPPFHEALLMSPERYLVWAVNEHRKHWRYRRHDAPFEDPLYHFVRLLKAHQCLRNADGKGVMKFINGEIEEWKKYDGIEDDGTFDPWSNWWNTEQFDYSADDAEIEILSLWETVKFGWGEDILDVALRRADKEPLTLNPGIRERQSLHYPRFISFCGWLQVLTGAQPIFLPREKVGGMFGINERNIGRLREAAVEDGYLCQVKRASQHKAAEYVFRVKAFPKLRKEASPGTLELWK